MNKGECLFPSKNYTWGSYRKEAPKAKKNCAELRSNRKAPKGRKDAERAKNPNNPQYKPE